MSSDQQDITLKELAAQYNVLREEVKLLDDESRKVVKIAYNAMQEILKEGGGHAVVALSLIGTELAMETLKVSTQETPKDE